MNISVEEGSNLDDVVMDITEKYGIVKYEMTQWGGISLNWITDSFCTYVCIQTEHLYYAVYKQYTKQTRLLQNKY